MNRHDKKASRLAMLIAACCIIAGCTPSSGNGNTANNNNSINYTSTLRVYNASEYIDESTLRDFEKEYSIKVEYDEFESNEEMYETIKHNPNAYDILVPSDYMVDRLIKEGALAKLDKSLIPNISHVAEDYISPAYDAGNDYTVPYMVGTLGVLYNKKQVAEPVESWSAIFDPNYSSKALMLDSERDAIGAALKMLGFSMNSSDDSELSQAKASLLASAHIFAFLESEDIRDRLVAGESYIGVVYSGDAKTAIDRNPNLAYSIPAEGANKWVDGFVILNSSPHIDEAHKFINYMCKPSIAVRNMAHIGYTSPIKGAWSEFGGNKIMFPSTEELERCEAFIYDEHATQKYHSIWQDIRGYW
ncbi:MAG: spermidine/putrescine ABC transporter substrate-binding protein [Eubacteriaceae bacterium]|nr:spermidine/putrescine ABC transporter substrate-binding protein [Eubacteriaceae bacterium]